MAHQWPLLLFCIVRLDRPANCLFNFTNITSTHMFNGHYINWPSKQIEKKFIKEKRFIPKNIIYTRFQLCSDSVYLIAPRYKRGVPFTLGNAILSDKDKCYNYVKPYPSIEKQDKEMGSCISGSLINVVDLVMGQDGVLWVLDIGMTNTLSDHPKKDDEPKIIGFDAVTGKIKHLISLWTVTCRSQSRFHYLAVQYMTNAKIVLYIGDSGTRSIIVWNVEDNEGSRIKLPHTVVQGCMENSKDEIIYIALIELQTGNYIYYTYLCSQNMFRTKLKDLRKRMSPGCIVNLGKKPCRMVILGVGYETVLYFRIDGQNDLFSWDTKLSFLEENIRVVRKSKDCRTITHLDIDNQGVLWILESNINDYFIDNVGFFGPSVMLSPVFDAQTPVTNEFDGYNY